MEITRKPYIAKHCLFQLAIEGVKNSIDINTWYLVLCLAILWLNPKNTRLISLKLLHKGMHGERRGHRVLNPSFHNAHTTQINRFHRSLRNNRLTHRNFVFFLSDCGYVYLRIESLQDIHVVENESSGKNGYRCRERY